MYECKIEFVGFTQKEVLPHEGILYLDKKIWLNNGFSKLYGEEH